MIDNYQKFTNYRNEYKSLYFEGVKSILSDFYIELELHYSLDKKIDFRHILRIKKNSTLKSIIDLKQYEKLIIGLGIVEGINYYKLAAPKNLIIECDELSDEEKLWWRNLYYNGLGEYRYLNNINISEEEFLNVESTGSKVEKTKVENLKGNLILVGGGKDSITSLELLKDEKDSNNILIVNPRPASLDSAKVAGYSDDEIIIVERIIDEKVIDMNKDGFLNGHIPFSAVLAFLSSFIGSMLGKKNIIVSNENSANEETVFGANHQYSKTFEFENKFRSYSHYQLFSDDEINYFSLLRPLTELQIVKLFVIHNEYLKIFKSCNVGSKILDKEEKWCGNCPKCLFVYILLLSQLPEEQVIDIIGNNMLDNLEMKEDFDKLIGIAPEKPFECIGTKDEVNAAMTIIINKEEYNKDNLPSLIKYYKEECKDKHLSQEKIDQILYNFDENNNVTCETKQKMKELLDIK